MKINIKWARLTDAERIEINQAAEAGGKSVSAWARDLLLKAARRVRETE